jgi:tetratricopeptide (TPR) repeat protein
MSKKHIKTDGVARPPETTPWTKVLISVALLTAITAIAYWRVGQNGFLNYDDNVYVTDNWYVQHGLSLESVKWAFGSARANNWHPLTWLSHMTDVQLFGMNAQAQHFMNLGIHLANTLLLFGFLAYCTRRLAPSWLVAALFAIHPLHVESVAWIAERKDVLSALFWMATMWMYAAYARRPSPGRYLGVLLIFALGLMAKPMLVTLPLVLLLLDYWPLNRFKFGEKLWERKLRFSGSDITANGLVVEKLPLLVMAGISCVMTIRAQHAAIATMESVDIMSRLTNAIVSYGRYIFSMFWPAGLAVFYPHPRATLYLQAAPILLLLIAVTALVLRYSRNRKYIVTGWLWYLITLIPVIGIIQVGDQSHADRYTYIPLTGLFVIVIWSVADIVEYRRIWRYVACACATVVLSLLALITGTDTGYWKDTETLCRRAISVTRGNYIMKTNLALELLTKGKIDEAMQQSNDSLSIRPDVPQSLSTMGLLLASQKKHEEALKYFFAALAKRPKQKELCFNIGASYLSMNRPADALPYSRRATEIDPHWSRAFLQLSIALNDTGRFEEAAVALARSKELQKR